MPNSSVLIPPHWSRMNTLYLITLCYSVWKTSKWLVKWFWIVNWLIFIQIIPISIIDYIKPFISCGQFLLEVARQKNGTPLPLIKPYTGPRLPPDRYCLTAPNYRLKSIQKKVRRRWTEAVADPGKSWSFCYMCFWRVIKSRLILSWRSSYWQQRTQTQFSWSSFFYF